MKFLDRMLCAKSMTGNPFKKTINYYNHSSEWTEDAIIDIWYTDIGILFTSKGNKDTIIDVRFTGIGNVFTANDIAQNKRLHFIFSLKNNLGFGR